MSRVTTSTAGDAGTDQRGLLLASGILLLTFAFGAVTQTVYWHTALAPAGTDVMVVQRIVANAAGLAANLVALAAFGVHRRVRLVWAMVGIVGAGVLGAGARTAAQVNLGLTEGLSRGAWLSDFAIGWLICIVANGVGLAYMLAQRRLGDQVRASSRVETQVQLALQALAQEEIRVRREVAEGLHGSLQQRLVLIARRVDEVASSLESNGGSDAAARSLREASAELEIAREGDVREMSRLLYPDAIEIGMVPAVRSLLGRLPATIGTRLVVSDAVRRLDDPAEPRLTQTERLLVVRVVEEAVTNALRHGSARQVDVVLQEGGGRIQVVVTDNGDGYDTAAADLGDSSGLRRLADRLAIVGGSLDITSMPGEGATVTAWIPVEPRGPVALP